MVFWVFGYGSLVWNPGFDYDEKVLGFIKDYRRVFDLGEYFYQYIRVLCIYTFLFCRISCTPQCLISIPYTHFVSCVTACIDHRGTPEHPARTCTLEQTEGAICVSIVYLMMYHILVVMNLLEILNFEVESLEFDLTKSLNSVETLI